MAQYAIIKFYICIHLIYHYKLKISRIKDKIPSTKLFDPSLITVPYSNYIQFRTMPFVYIQACLF